MKSRRRDPRALDFGRYVLVDSRASNHEEIAASAFANGGGKTFDEIEQVLMRDPV